MFGPELHQLKNDFHKYGIIFCYSGHITEDTLLGIGETIKKQRLLDETDSRTAKMLFSLFVEQVQNMIRYSEEKEEREDSRERRSGILLIGREERGFFISCGNKIKAEDVPRLKRRLSWIQQMDAKELKNAWKEGLRSEPDQGSKGAGIGFIDIARKAKGGIDFDFQTMDEKNAFFSLKAYV